MIKANSEAGAPDAEIQTRETGERICSGCHVAVRDGELFLIGQCLASWCWHAAHFSEQAHSKRDSWGWESPAFSSHSGLSPVRSFFLIFLLLPLCFVWVRCLFFSMGSDDRPCNRWPWSEYPPNPWNAWFQGLVRILDLGTANGSGGGLWSISQAKSNVMYFCSNRL